MAVNVQDISAHWLALHEALGIGQPIAGEAQYLQPLKDVDALVDQTGDQDDHPLWALISLLGDHIRAYEDRVHPWPDTTALTSPMEDHGLRQ